MVAVELIWVLGSGLSLVGLGAVGCCCGGQQQQQQQQQIVNMGSDEERKRVCPECGMENPTSANHCGDCGFSFGDGGENTDE